MTWRLYSFVSFVHFSHLLICSLHLTSISIGVSSRFILAFGMNVALRRVVGTSMSQSVTPASHIFPWPGLVLRPGLTWRSLFDVASWLHRHAIAGGTERIQTLRWSRSSPMRRSQTFGLSGACSLCFELHGLETFVLQKLLRKHLRWLDQDAFVGSHWWGSSWSTYDFSRVLKSAMDARWWLTSWAPFSI